jgi:hypothetical protein
MRICSTRCHAIQNEKAGIFRFYRLRSGYRWARTFTGRCGLHFLEYSEMINSGAGRTLKEVRGFRPVNPELTWI